MSAAPLPAFAAYGIELEYMIVDAQTLSLRPVADTLLSELAGAPAAEVDRGGLAWSNELVLHVLELKNARPSPDLPALAAAFQSEVGAVGRRLAAMGARLMPSAAHPWMDPHTETHLWPGEHAAIYRAYDRIFGCRSHGWANLQSMHVNLPFADDGEFARLHAAVRLLLPILPALAASSPIADGGDSGFLDFRMEAYRSHVLKIPALIGAVIPDALASRLDHARALATMYRDLAPFDSEGVLRHEWVNARGAIPRFDRHAVEIRVIDVQECPRADLAVAAATIASVRALYEGRWGTLEGQREIATDALAQILRACIHDAELTVIEDAAYLRLLGYPGGRCEARELWHHLIGTMPGEERRHWGEALDLLLARGPLARRILRAVAADFRRDNLRAVYGELCRCLEEGRMFLA
ncbi:glutamate--cysteine ligase [mine drainage metagenome]|uniref:Glutamate--cysteine ligase n=1 Tax=mine drainage metagenome TaxID=410659 RepID=A0A1J5RKG1_9ZZZZ